MMIHPKSMAVGSPIFIRDPNYPHFMREMGESKVLLLTQTVPTFNHFHAQSKLVQLLGNTKVNPYAKKQDLKVKGVKIKLFETTT